MKSRGRWQRRILAAAALALAVASLILLARVKAPSPADAIRAAERARTGDPDHRGANPELSADDDIRSSAVSESERRWSPEPTTFSIPGRGEHAPVRALRLDGYDPTRPGPHPNPFLDPKLQLTREDTRAGLD